MQRIETLLQKVMDMSARGSKNTAIDIDLMMDYIKVVYADLLEMRARAVYTSDMPQEKPETKTVAAEPPQSSSVISTITPEPIAAQETPATPEVTIVEEPATDGAIIATEEESEIKIPEPQPLRQEPVWVEVPPAYNFPVKHDIRKVIGINDKYTFISELFGDDKEAYESTLDEISKMESHDEALEWTRENMLFTDDADGQSETAQLFYDTLSKFFSER